MDRRQPTRITIIALIGLFACINIKPTTTIINEVEYNNRIHRQRDGRATKKETPRKRRIYKNKTKH